MYSDFDTSEPPFSLLTDEERTRAVRGMDILFIPAGTRVIEAGKVSSHLYVVDKGLIEERQPKARGGDSAVAHYRDGEVFGSLAILRGRARHTYKAAEDTLCHALPGELFRELVYANAEFGEFFHQDLATKTKLVAQSGAYRDLVSFNLARVDPGCMRTAVVLSEEDSIRDAVEIMRSTRSDCVLASRGDDYGILTRTNMLEAVALGDHSLDDPATSAATWNMITIGEGEFLFDALIRMIRHGIERLVVVREGSPIGLVEMSDILGFLSSHSHVVALRVESASSFEDLKHASKDVIELARSLFAQRVNVRFIMDLLAEIHRRILARNFDLLIPPEVLSETCLLVLGSEGRGEQVMRTDQSNALVIDSELDWADRQNLLDEFTERTQRLGYPPSPRRMVVSNPDWARDEESWRTRLAEWLELADDAAVLSLSAILDAVPIAGKRDLFTSLQSWLQERLPSSPGFFEKMLRPVLTNGDAPAFFEQKTRRGREVDLKQYGIFPIVHGVRTLTLEAGLSSLNTFRRLEALKDDGVIEAALADDLSEALLLFNRLRLGRQLQRLEDSDSSLVPSEVASLVHTGQLSSSELALLRDAFRKVRELRTLLTERYGLG
jgi:CBS domain-containing protein